MGRISDIVIDRAERMLKVAIEPLPKRDRSKPESGSPGINNPRRQSRPLTDNDVDSFLHAAEQREDPLWLSIDRYISGPLWFRSPSRSKSLKREIRWMRRMAAKDGIDWGRR